MRKNTKKFIKHYYKNNLFFAIFCILFLFLLLTRFYELEKLSTFGFDQVDNAWVAKDIIVDHKFPLVGMQAKGNTGFYIGPYYYYFLVPFYFITNLDPIASGIVAGITAIFTFFVVYFVTRNIFNEKVALFALFITVFSSYILELDRVQWPVNFIVPFSFLFFFSLYKIVSGKVKYILLLTLVFGLSLHVHFTSVFYLIFCVFIVPFIPRNKLTLKYTLYSLPIMLFFIWPIVLNFAITNNESNAASYLGTNYHGFHLRRFLQIVGEGLIEFNSILKLPYAIFVSFVAVTSYITLILKSKMINRRILIILSAIWILVPWVLFSTYSGELTNYYFSITRPVAIFVFAFLLYKIFSIRAFYLRSLLFVLLGFYVFDNVSHFLNTGPVGLQKHRKDVLEKIYRNEKIEFVMGDPQSYIYYLKEQYKNEK